jgi:hypothetical protein
MYDAYDRAVVTIGSVGEVLELLKAIEPTE